MATVDNDVADAWIIARHQYVLDLSDEERRLFENATLENLLLTSTEAQATHQKNSRSRAVMFRLKPFLLAIQEYGSALDVYASTYPTVLAPIWGSLRVLLQLASQFNKIFDRIVDILERIGYVIPRFHIYEKLYGVHPRIIKALSAAYLDIITLCMEIKAFIRSIQKSRIKSFTKLFSPLEHHLSEVVDRFRLHKEDVEMEAEACHMIEAAKSYELQLSDREVAALEQKSQLRKHLLSLLSPIDYTGKQRKLQQLRQEGTGGWIFEEKDYKEWKAMPASSILSVFGIPGSGKTVLSSGIVDRLQEGAVDRELISYHYCDYKDTRSLDAITIVGTLLKGLLESIDITDQLSTLITASYQDGQRVPDVEEMSQIIDCVLELHTNTNIYIVIDGVDELHEQQRKLTFGFLKHLVACEHSIQKLVISSRAQSSNSVYPSRMKLYQIHISESRISSDICVFVRKEVKNLIDSRDLLLRDPLLEEEIIEILVSGAKGMFLWVTFQLISLCECDSDADIRQTLRNLPRDLTETYERLLARIQTPHRKVLIRRMLQWIVCARRQFHIEELLEAIAFTIEDCHWDATKIPNDATRLVRASGNLIVVDEEEYTVQLAHYTVQQFLLGPGPDTLGFSYHFTRMEAELYAAETCIIYLCFSDFETQLTRYTNRTKAHMAIIERALLESTSIAQGGLIVSAVSTISRFVRPIGKYKPSNIDFTRHVPQAIPGLQSKYQMLGYIVNEWLHHTSALEPIKDFTPSEDDIIQTNSLEIWRRFKTLASIPSPLTGYYTTYYQVFQKQLLFNLKPWSEVKVQSTDQPHMALVCWAVRKGHVALLECLNSSQEYSVHHYFEQATNWFVSKNQQYEHKNKRIIEISNILLPDLKHMMENPDPCALFYFLIEACIRGDVNVTSLFVQGWRDGKIKSPAFVLEYIMIEAAAHGQESICQMLTTDCNCEAYTLYRDRPCNALRRAAFMGNTTIVSILQSITVAGPLDKTQLESPELWVESEAKLLIGSARLGNLDVVKCLLAACCAVDTPITESKTELLALSNVVVHERALMQAVNGGQKDVVAYLLDSGVNPNNPLPWELFDSDAGKTSKSTFLIPRMIDLGCFALHLAISHNDPAMVHILLEAEADPDLCIYYFQQEKSISSKWKSPLAHASFLGNVQIARYLISFGAAIESQFLPSKRLESMRFRYTTPLIQAVSSGHKDMVDFLLTQGADLDNYDHTSFTPLAAAAANRTLDCARVLIMKGAKLDDIRENEVHQKISLASPAVEAIRQGDIEMLSLLLEAGINLNTPIQRNSPLMAALTEGNVKMTEMLIRYGADVNGDAKKRDALGWPAMPLCRAIRGQQTEIVRLLVQNGADLYCVGGWGRNRTTPLETAKEYSSCEVGRIVLEQDMLLNPPTSNEHIEEVKDEDQPRTDFCEDIAGQLVRVARRKSI